MSSFILKLIASVAMLLDHIGYFSSLGFADIGRIMRLIGRTAFPIYCFLITVGFRKTHNKYRYLLRLIVVGIVSELPYRFCFDGKIDFAFSNVYFTLASGLAALILYDLLWNTKTKWVRYLAWLPVAGFALLTHFLSTDYSFSGVLLIFFFYLAKNNKPLESVACAIFALRKFIIPLGVTVLSPIASLLPIELPSKTLSDVSTWEIYQVFAALAIIPILLFNGSKGYEPRGHKSKKMLQYGFYIFYPVHILIIGIIMRLIVIPNYK